jgi:hypothetical protein
MVAISWLTPMVARGLAVALEIFIGIGREKFLTDSMHQEFGRQLVKLIDHI